MLVFDEFVDRVCEMLSIEAPEHPQSGDSLCNDLGLDSFQVFELLVVVEELAGGRASATAVPEVSTLSDAFDHYQDVYRATDL